MDILKIEAFSGLSGDMFLGALAALSDGYDDIIKLPAQLHLEQEAEVVVREMNKKGIQCKHIKIIDKNNQKHKKDTHAGHTHHHHHHHHHHRHLKDINAVIENGNISAHAKTIAKQIFLLLGEAESKVHGIPLEKIHFHEVGAIDSMLDIIGSAVLIDKLGIKQTYCTPVNTGFGFANTEHGRLPVPCPATQILLTDMPTYRGEIESEMTTPTGAAILRFLDPVFEIPVLVDKKIGYGPGEKDFRIPNVLRLSLCTMQDSGEEVVVVQTNIDDMPAEYLGVEFQDKLWEAGALDFYYEQVIMKRGRPGLVLTVLARSNHLNAVTDCLFTHTTSIGLRYYTAKRKELVRETRSEETPYGNIQFKETILPDNQKRTKPESQDIIRAADKAGKSPLDVLRNVSKNPGDL